MHHSPGSEMYVVGVVVLGLVQKNAEKCTLSPFTLSLVDIISRNGKLFRLVIGQHKNFPQF